MNDHDLLSYLNAGILSAHLAGNTERKQAFEDIERYIRNNKVSQRPHIIHGARSSDES